MNDDNNFESVKANPSETYDDPKKVLDDDSLSEEKKLEILTSWKSEAIHLQESEAEGLSGGETSRLDSIETAIRSLSNDNSSSVLKDLNEDQS